MTATAVDTMTVAALDAKDAADIARRQLEWAGFRVLVIEGVEPAARAGVWRVTATVELVRP